MGCAGSSGTNAENLSENYIIAEYNIIEDILEEKQVIYNAVNNVVHEGEDENVNRDVRECEIKINDEIVPFDQDYQFPKVGLYKIKYTFKSPLTDASSLFFYCQCLKKVDLSHFQGQKLQSVREMFSGCELMESINLSNLDLQNVTDMSNMFSGCASLKVSIYLIWKLKK